ncbi:MAG: transposase [Gammaproteobacteria bacterium]|nr:transposase [Gammaproteobacteria bacterium]
MNKLTDVFCDVDDFCKVFMPEWEAQLIADGTRKRNRQSRMTMSEIMTIIIAFHSSNQRDFKNYYTGFVARFYKDYFPNLLSYTRFLAVMPKALTPLCAYFTHIKGKPTGISFVDSTSIKVCHNLRIERHKTFAGIAKRGRGRWAGFMVSNCTLLSIMSVTFWLPKLPLLMLMIENLFQN